MLPTVEVEIADELALTDITQVCSKPPTLDRTLSDRVADEVQYSALVQARAREHQKAGPE